MELWLFKGYKTNHDFSHLKGLPRLPQAFAKIIACRADLMRQGLLVLSICLVIAVVLWALRSKSAYQTGFGYQLIYSLSIGMLSWAIIDFGRFFIDQDSPYVYPRGWKGKALIFVGVIVGFVCGITIGDWASGRSTREMFQLAPNAFAYMVVFSLAFGLGISYFFYAWGKQAYLLSQLETKERQATEAQLKLLQSQLDPHMLFNTLANLRALIGSQPSQALQMLDQLNDYLRATLSASRSPMHSLSAEFDRLSDYLALMQVRMGQRLQFELNLPADLRNTPVPSLILQSLVENAIVHGLEPKVEGGKVTVIASRVAAHGQDNLCLQVQDNGLGFDTALFKEGFGIAQVRERLASLYGNLVTIHLVAAPAYSTGDFPLNDAQKRPSGCSVSLVFPLQVPPSNSKPSP